MNQTKEDIFKIKGGKGMKARKANRCPDCNKVVYRRKIGGKFYNDVHLLNANTQMEAIIMCSASRLSQMLRF